MISFRRIKRRRRAFITLLVCLIIFVVSCFNFSWIVPIKVWCLECCSYPKKCIYALKENTDLKREIIALKLQVEEKNELVQRKKMSRHIERVLAYEQNMFVSDLFITISNQKVKIGNIVVSPDGLIGILHKITNNIGVVKPITSSSVSIPSKTKSGTLLVLQGNNSNELKSIAIKDNKLHINDMIFTSGEGGLFPANIKIGKVIKLTENSVYIKPSVDFYNLEFVSIIDSIKIN